MKKTALYQKHVDLGAKMVPFAGFEMPVQYTGVTQEHFAVREKVGVFDVSHMGQFKIEGKNALDLIQKITTNDASKLSINQAQYSCMTNPQGGIIDDLIVYKIAEEEYLLVVNASRLDQDWDWITQNNTDCKITNISDDTSLLAIQGPQAIEAMQSLTTIDLSAIKFYHFQIGAFAGVEGVIISATGYTGAGGLEIYFPNTVANTMWDKVMEAGKNHGIQPCGLAARDTLRLEKGYCLYGNDIDMETTPLEAGLGWITKFTKDFTASEVLQEQKEQGISKKLVGFTLLDRGVPRHDYDIATEQGTTIGRVTSGTQSPMLKKGMGLGYVEKKYAKPGTHIYIKVRKKLLKAEVVKLPFV